MKFLPTGRACEIGNPTCETYTPPSVRTSYRDSNVYLFPISLDRILSVSFGVNTPVEDKKKIIDRCAGHNIAFFQALIPKDEQNEVGLVHIGSFGSLRDYLNMPPQLFTFDSIETQYHQQPTIKVGMLSEIPYYAIQKEDYDLYHARRKSTVAGDDRHSRRCFREDGAGRSGHIGVCG